MATPKNKKTDNTINEKALIRKQQDHALNASMLFFALAIIALLGMSHPFDLEYLMILNKCMKYLLGKCHIMLPLLFLIFSARMLLGIALGRLNASFISFLLTLFSLPGLIHHYRVPLHEELVPSELLRGGGIIGGSVTLLLRRSVGETWTYAILIGCILLALALVMPWKTIFKKSRKKDDKFDKYLANSNKDSKKTEARSQSKVEPKAFSTSNEKKNNVAKPVLPFKNEPKPVKAEAPLPRQNVYQDDEFSSFTDGIKKETTFKRILNLGIKDGTYEQEDIREEIERDPVQIPEWEEEPKRQPVLRPVVNYEGEKVVSMPQGRFLDPQANVEQEPEHLEDELPKHEADALCTEESTAEAKPYESIIYNPYHKMQQDLDITEVEKPEAKETVAEDAEQATEAPEAAEEPAQEEVKPTFVIHKRVDEGQEEYVDAQQAINEATRKEAGLAEEVPAEAPVVEAAKPVEPPKPKYIFPPYDLLSRPKLKDRAAGEAEIMQQCSILEQTLADFKVRANVVAATRGPAVTQFELQPAPGVKVNSVVNLADDIALRLAASGVRIEAPIPGKSAIGIEVPNLKTDPVSFREVVDSDVVRNHKSKLGVGLGKDISGEIITADIAKMPHLLIAGSTGSGKSVCINTIICGILYKALPEEVKLILVDPKVVELSIYDGIPHLLTPVVTDPKKAASALHWAVAEMERRYKLFADNHVRNIDGFNTTVNASDKMPYIVIIIDEMADLMTCVKADIETAIMRLAAKARAAGIHMILATQRPSVDVITGVLKNNIPSRIAFAVTSLIDSRTILDSAGAEKLLGKGDMLYAPYGSPKPTRVQGSFVSDEEVGSIVDFIKDQSLPVEYSDEVTSVELESDKKAAQEAKEEDNEPAGPTDDPLFEKALMLVLDTGQASASMMQRRFSIGYNRAARLVDTMAELGVVGKSMGSKPREVIMSRQEAEERFLNKE